MELLQNTQTARLVLAYLYNQQFESLAQEFCRKSPYLRDEQRLLEIGDVPIRPFCRPLVQIFSEYNRMCMQLLTLIGQYEDKVCFPDSLSELDKMDIILNLNRGRTTPCLQNLTNLSPQRSKKPPVVSYTSQVVKPAVNVSASPITSEPFAPRPNDVAGGTVLAVPSSDSIPTPTIHLCRDELIQLLMCERDKENDNTALAYLLQQEANGNGVSETLPISQSEKENGTIPPDGPPDGAPYRPADGAPSQISPDQPSVQQVNQIAVSVPVTATVTPVAAPIDQSEPNQPEQPMVATVPPNPPTIGEVVGQTGMKEIVAARILGSMAKAGFRSSIPNDTPPGNPIVKETTVGTRSTSSRKRSHIRILDFGTPASKRSSSLPGSEARSTTADGSHSRKLFSGQGTPVDVHGNPPEVPSSVAFTMPTLTPVSRVSGDQTAIAQRVQDRPPPPHDRAVEEKHASRSRNKICTDVAVCSTASSTSSVVTSSETCVRLSVAMEERTVPPLRIPLEKRLHSTAEASKQSNRTGGETTFASKRKVGSCGTATTEKKPATFERTHSGTHLKIHTTTSQRAEFSSVSQHLHGDVHETVVSHHRKHSRATIAELQRGITPAKLHHTTTRWPRASPMVTRSSTKSLTAKDFTLGATVTNISKLPTKDSVPKMAAQPVPLRAGRSCESVTGEPFALHNTHNETPYKFDPLADYPMTPRFLTDPFLSVSKLDASALSAVGHCGQRSVGRCSAIALSETADINTPAYPITPGAPGTPQSQHSPGSAPVCYYRPDEGDAGQPANETLPAATADQTAVSRESSMATECASDDSDKMEIVSGGVVFMISSTPLLELYQQEPST